jgi:hypothetical protein
MGDSSVVTKVRSETHVYSGKVRYSLDGGAPSLQGGSDLSAIQTVTADYPDWDYRKLIATGQNACTSLSASRNGFVVDSVQPTLEKDGYPARPMNPGIINNVSMSEFLVSYFTLSGGKPTNRHTQRLFGNPWASNLTLPSTDANLLASIDNQANMIFRSKALKFIRLFSGGVFIGELKEAIHLMRHPAMAIRRDVGKYLHRLQSRRFRKSYRRSKPGERRKMLSDSWLEFSFGWSPLVNDVIDGAGLVSRLVNDFHERKLIRAHALGRKVSSGNDNVSTTGGNLKFNRRKEQRFLEVLVIYQGLVSADPGDRALGFNQGVLASAGLDLLDFIPTIYELIPFSFLVDYFTNIGGIIDAACHFNVGQRWVNKTVLVLQTSKWTEVELSHGFGASVVIDSESRIPGSRVVRFSKSVTRTPDVFLTLPELEFHLPFSNVQWINIAALSSSLNRAKSGLRI